MSGAPEGSLSPRRAEVEDKLVRLRSCLQRRGADAAVLTRVANFAWLTGGGRAYVNVASEGGVAWICVTPARVAVLTNNIEADRLREEELAGLDWEVLASDWWDDAGMLRRLTEVIGSGLRGRAPRVLADAPLPGLAPGAEVVDGTADLVELRTQLSEPERVRAAELGRETAQALEACCREVRPGEEEHRIAARLAEQCLARAIVPVVALVATDERVYRRRHPLPTRARLQRYAMVVVCGLRGGLVVSCTRLVHLGPLEADLRRRWQAAAQVDAEMIAATRPGATAGEVFAAAQAAYSRCGFPDEWRHHHQGGLAGYASREWRALPGGRQRIGPHQLFAWNPSVAGAKSEDTILTLPPAGEGQQAPLPRVLTDTGDWPQAEVHTAGGLIVRRPEILVL
jgi:Xaa-Pro aminopeptidase